MSIAEKLTAIAENEQKVYAAGQEQGKQEAYDEFWDSYQENGERADYKYAFANWKTTQFNPKYNLTPTGATTSMFSYFGRGSTEPIDLVEFLESKGITLDFKNATNAGSVFAYSNISRVGVIDVTGCTGNGGSPFANAKELVTVDKYIVNDALNLGSAFTNCTKLQNIVFEGFISCASNLQWSSATRLSRDSIMSAVNALIYWTGTAGARKIVLGSTNLAKLSEEDKAQIEAKGWTYA